VIRSLDETICRKAANDVLDEFHVQKPGEIDLETIAWIGGRRLQIIEGGLEGADGRLVATVKGGTIRLKPNLTPIGRKRFTIAHEIGHRVLHGTGATNDTQNDLCTWTRGSKETEANVFASELLMPERLFKQYVYARSPSLGFIDELAEQFATSSLAAGITFIQYTDEPCALIISKKGQYKWARKSRNFEEFYIKRGQVHAYTGAAEIFRGEKRNTAGMDRTPAGAWLEHYDLNSKATIQEDSRLIQDYSEVVTLLWIDKDIEDNS